MYKAIYRKYRPTTFAEVVGQQHIVRTLQNAIEQNKVGHAYLFHGPRGTGKTSIAKLFAQAVNCQSPDKHGRPCHACENCTLIDSGKATDIIELDAASNNGVDEIRQIREFTRYAPTQLQYKVYIIDEVHMLSTAAFNALLKTLEEPPAYVIFILATTEIHKIPQTIISRCQRFDFKKVTVPEMKQCILPILEKEQITMTDEALTYLAEYADGGMRDALSILDQVSSYSTGEVTLTDIQDVIGTVSSTTYAELIQHVLDKNSKATLLILDDIIASGKNVQLFIEEFLRYLLRELEKALLGQSTFSPETLFFMVEKMNMLAAEMRFAFLPHVALQALFLELTYEREQHPELELQPLTPRKTETPSPTTNPTLDLEEIRPENQAVAPAEQTRQVAPAPVVSAEPLPAEEPEIKRTENNPELEREFVAMEQDLGIEPTASEPELELAVSEITEQEPELAVAEITDPEIAVSITNRSPASITFSATHTNKPEPSSETTMDDVLALFDADNFEDDNESEEDELISTDDGFYYEEITTIFDEIYYEKQQAKTAEKTGEPEVIVEETTPAEPELSLEERERQIQAATQLHEEKRRLLLQRVMAEVVINPEYNQLEKIKRKWQLIKFDPTNPMTAMMYDMEPKIATKKELVLSSFNKALINQVQLQERFTEAQTFLETLLGEVYDIIFVDESMWMVEREKFSNLYRARQINDSRIEELSKQVLTLEEQAKAQGYEYITLDFDNETEPEVEEEPIVQDARALFGDDLVEVK